MPHFLSIGTFAESAARPKPDRPAAPIGCGALTGVEAALHPASIAEADPVVVIGGVGLDVVQGRLAGVGRVIAVDLAEAGPRTADKLGVAHVIRVGRCRCPRGRAESDRG